MYHKSTKCISTAFVEKRQCVPDGFPGNSAASAPGDAGPPLGDMSESAPAHARRTVPFLPSGAFKLSFSKAYLSVRNAALTGNELRPRWKQVLKVLLHTLGPADKLVCSRLERFFQPRGAVRLRPQTH